jgi:hypothetical protein
MDYEREGEGYGGRQGGFLRGGFDGRGVVELRTIVNLTIKGGKWEEEEEVGGVRG